MIWILNRDLEKQNYLHVTGKLKYCNEVQLLQLILKVALTEYFI